MTAKSRTAAPSSSVAGANGRAKIGTDEGVAEDDARVLLDVSEMDLRH